MSVFNLTITYFYSFLKVTSARVNFFIESLPLKRLQYFFRLTDLEKAFLDGTNCDTVLLSGNPPSDARLNLGFRKNDRSLELIQSIELFL